MEQLSVWVGAGLLTAGVSAALIAGAGVASADTDSGSDSSGSGSTSSSDASAGSATAKADAAPDTKKTPASSVSGTTTTSTPAADTSEPTEATVSEREERPSKRTSKAANVKKATAAETTAAETKTSTPAASDDTSTADAPDLTPPKQPEPDAVETTAVETDAVEAPVESESSHVVAQPVAAQPVSAKYTRSALAATSDPAPVAAGATPVAPALLGVVQGLLGAVVTNVGSLVFNTVQAIEALVTGPPLIPPGSTVTVHSSTVQLSNGQTVPANWYYPDGYDVPEHMILLQHGFFALGPMYSYTAANLAEQTKSIVVTTTLSSNPFAGDSFWLGGTGMAASIADLFEGDRAALTQSAMEAGFANRYGLDAELPRQFALAGHSLGANLVSGAAGSLADDCTRESCAADDLVGVILLDGVPVGDTLPNALNALNAKESLTGYVPVREIGAPLNLFNFTSTVNQDLTEYRPDRFKGVVLDGGVHMDSMRGGNSLIQFAAYLIAGNPEAQNPPAVEALSVQWLADWFEGHTDNGDDLLPGTTIEIPTAAGTARGMVIGNPPVTLASSQPTEIPSANPWLASLAV